MGSPLLNFFTGGTRRRGRNAVETITPVRTFADVILPPSTRRTLDQALDQVRNHALIFGHWGLGERHATGLGLAFNFAGPPGTGKTICAEAIAHVLGRQLLVVDYSAVESMWAGETAKNVAAVFQHAEEEGAVLFFDEADAIASRRAAGGNTPYQREANSVVNVLLRELEGFNGVVIFATNLAVNFDPAFERRIRTHVLFEMPGVAERAGIWRAQIHPTKTPLADDVDFQALAERYPASGGDIKNAVLKAAASAAAERAPVAERRIHQRHLEQAMEDVIAARAVMRQSLFDAPAADGASGTALVPGDGAAAGGAPGMAGLSPAEQQMAVALQAMEARWRSTTLAALTLGGAALLAAVGALVALAVR
jgi:hypothetical protein